MTRCLALAVSLLAVALLPACSHTSPPASAGDPGARPGVALKRASLWVTDLDRAIVFYRDVLGFALVQRGPLRLDAGSVLWELFNLPPGTPVERALFSSRKADRVLFVMAAPGAPEALRDAPRSPALVVASDDLEGAIARARALGFAVGKRQQSPASSDPARQLTEQILIGPGGQPVLVYQLGTR